MLHYDNRFAKNLQLLFVCADMLLRHRVNSAVGATVKNNPEALQQWFDAVQDKDVAQLLPEAKKTPRSRATADLIAKVMNFLHIAGRKLDHSSFRRRSCLTEMRKCELVALQGNSSALPQTTYTTLVPCDGRLLSRVTHCFQHL